jgi:hypothetical protein
MASGKMRKQLVAARPLPRAPNRDAALIKAGSGQVLELWPVPVDLR